MSVKVPVRNTVLHWNDHRIGAEHSWDGGRHRRNLVSLQGQNDQILGTRRSVVRGCIDTGERLLRAIWPQQTQAVGLQRLQIRAPRDESDILAGQCEAEADKAA